MFWVFFKMGVSKGISYPALLKTSVCKVRFVVFWVLFCFVIHLSEGFWILRGKNISYDVKAGINEKENRNV